MLGLDVVSSLATNVNLEDRLVNISSPPLCSVLQYDSGVEEREVLLS